VKSIRWKKGKESTAENIQFTDSTKYESIDSMIVDAVVNQLTSESLHSNVNRIGAVMVGVLA
jgi:hypothetical protein